MVFELPKIVSYFKKFKETKHLFVIFTTLFSLAFFYGLFQQYHATRYYFGLIGLVFGISNKYRFNLMNSEIKDKKFF